MVFNVIKPTGKSRLCRVGRQLSREMTVIEAILLTIKTVIVAPNKICYNLSAGSNIHGVSAWLQRHTFGIGYSRDYQLPDRRGHCSLSITRPVSVTVRLGVTKQQQILAENGGHSLLRSQSICHQTSRVVFGVDKSTAHGN